MDNNFFSSKYMRALGGLTLLMLLIALASYATLNFEKVDFLNPTPATISVAGEGEVLAVPDIGQFSFSVNAEGADAEVAQAESAQKINAILAYLKEQGIEDKDVKTQNYNLYPKWRYEERICLSTVSYCPPGERVQDGFEVSQSVSVKLRDTATAGTIISGVGERGATNISGLNFTIDDTDALKEEARAKAIADAQAKAQILADQLGVEVVRIVGYYEDGGSFYPMYDTKMMAMGGDSQEMFEEAANMPTGEESTSVRVNITYEVR